MLCILQLQVVKSNKDVYIYQSFRKEDGKSSSRIYKKLGKYNSLLEQFNGDDEKLMVSALGKLRLNSRRLPAFL